MAKQNQDALAADFEPHLTITVGAHMDLWHRFKKPTREKHGVQLHTKCGIDINDHWNIRSAYNPRYHNYCAKCFPHGVNEDGSTKVIERPAKTESTGDAAGDGATAPTEPGLVGSGVPLSSTPEPLVSGDVDAGDGGAAPEEGSGVLGTEDEGHVEELQVEREAGSASVASSPDPEGGQGSKVREPSKRPTERSAGERKPKKDAN